MDHKKIRAIGAGILVAVWLLLTGFSWFGPAKDISEAERRPLAQMPEFSVETLLDGKFMSKFEDFTLDQFPLRDTAAKLYKHKLVAVLEPIVLALLLLICTGYLVDGSFSPFLYFRF